MFTEKTIKTTFPHTTFPNNHIWWATDLNAVQLCKKWSKINLKNMQLILTREKQ